MTLFERVLHYYESRKFEPVWRGWCKPPAGTRISSGVTQRMADCGDYEFYRLYTGISSAMNLNFSYYNERRCENE